MTFYSHSGNPIFYGSFDILVTERYLFYKKGIAPPHLTTETGMNNPFRNVTKSRRASALLLAILSLALATFILTTDEVDTRTLQTNEGTFKIEEASNSTSAKPLMMTFYEKTGHACCGMSSKQHQVLLQAWETSWQDRGWDTKILTKKDAEKNPEFQALQAKFTEIGYNSEYERRCYWRWLAMAAIEDENGGGGWMSDYDTFPLNLSAEAALEIAKDGTFKSFSRHVPCLIHASREEWERVFHLMVDYVDQHGKRSDMQALLGVSWGPSNYKMIFTDNGVAYIHSRHKDGELYIDCKKLKNKKFAHLSHKATSDAWSWGLYPKIDDDVHNFSNALSRRGEAAMIAMKDYREQCLDEKGEQKLRQRVGVVKV